MNFRFEILMFKKSSHLSQRPLVRNQRAQHHFVHHADCGRACRDHSWFECVAGGVGLLVLSVGGECECVWDVDVRFEGKDRCGVV